MMKKKKKNDDIETDSRPSRKYKKRALYGPFR